MRSSPRERATRVLLLLLALGFLALVLPTGVSSASSAPLPRATSDRPIAPSHQPVAEAPRTSQDRASFASPPPLSPAPPPAPRALTTVGFFTTPHTCGSITLNGTTYTYGQSTQIAAGSYTVSALPCATWKLVSLKGGGAVSITGATATVAAGFGNISADFTGQTYTVGIYTNPTSCGSVTLNTTTSTDGQTQTSSPGDFSVTATACTGYYTSNLVGGGSIVVTFPGGVAAIGGNGTITATFSPKSLNLTVASSPLGCGGAVVGGKGIRSGQTAIVLAGSYTYDAWGCTGHTLSAVNGTHITVTPWNPGYPINGTLTILQDGSLNLFFSTNVYNITFLDTPGNGGYLEVGGIPYYNDTVGTFSWGSTLGLSAVSYNYFQAINDPINLSKTGPEWIIPQYTVEINGSGFINTTFVPIWYSVLFTTNQAPCELTTVVFNRSTFALVDAAGAQVKAGDYNVSGPFCLGFHFDGYSASGSVSVSPNSGFVWVNGSGAITVLFNPIFLPVSGVVEQWPSGSPVAGATVFILYGESASSPGFTVNQTSATGSAGSWSLLMVYGSYAANATAPLFTSGPAVSFMVNGTPSGVHGIVVWINTTLGLPSTPPGLLGYVTSFPGVLVPIVVLLALLALVLVVHLERKWSKKARLERERASRPPAAPPPPGPPGVAGPPGPPPPGLPAPGAPAWGVRPGPPPPRQLPGARPPSGPY